MTEPVYISEDDVYGRCIRITTKNWDGTSYECRFCGSPTAINIDTSDGEYMSFTCCAPCFTQLAEQYEAPSNDSK